MEAFKQLGIEDSLLKSLKEQEFKTPTEIQAKTIPEVLQGKDVIAGSATGSGKTLAFGSAIVQKISKGKGIKALIMTPTRELAEQVHSSLKTFAKHKPLNITTVYGGVSIEPQMKALKNADVVVGTPGRILDHISRDTIDLGKIEYLVLDEADRMLDMGFLPDVEKIMKSCPAKKRQTMLFSATLPPEVSKLSKKFMKDPVKINAVQHVDPKKLTQVYYDVPNKLKFSLLVHLLKKESSGLVMVFCNSRNMTDTVAKNLQKQDFDAMAIHGGLTQAQRTKTLSRFNSNKALILVCTDVAARGLDIPGVSHVYNYDVPNDSKQYIHRIGRTARAGESGRAIILLSEKDHDNFQRVLQDNDVKVKKMDKPYIQMVGFQTDSKPKKDNGPRGRFDSGQGRGPRRSKPQSRRPRRS